jgi:hypothetical protein
MASECSLLPLTWLEFTAHSFGHLTSRLLWKTADEINHAFFEVERRDESAGNFDVIGRIDSDPSQSNVVHGYSFIDRNAKAGENYYRIRQVDVDGRSTYSPIRSVTFDTPGFRVSSHPNPASVSVDLNIQNAVEGGSMILLNATGQYLWSETYPAGNSNFLIPVSGLPPGMYSLLLTDSSQQHVERIAVIR